MSLNDAPILAMPWLDVFGFTDRTSVECPDCERLSPEFEDIWSALKWVDEHHRSCPA